MAWGVDQVKLVVLAVFGVIAQRHCMRLNGNASLPLQVHIIENLLLHIPLLHRAGQLQQSVRQSGLAVVNVGNDGKIANVLFLYSQWSSSESQRISARAPKMASRHKPTLSSAYKIAGAVRPLLSRS